MEWMKYHTKLNKELILALIPKINITKSLKDYRPISLIGCLYMIISIASQDSHMI